MGRYTSMRGRNECWRKSLTDYDHILRPLWIGMGCRGIGILMHAEEDIIEKLVED